jgi:hypothetical protein
MNRAAATALIAVAMLAVPATASAAVNASDSGAATAANRRADRAALNAYATYLEAIVTDKASATSAETLFASTTSTTCYKALEPVATSQTVPPGTSSALTDIGDEIGADAGLEFLTSADTPMSQLVTTLSTLHWGTTAPANTVKRFLAADEALLAVQPSNLCADALSIATQAGAQQVSVAPATVSFLSAYQAGTTLANARLATFVKMLDSWSTLTDRATALKIDLLAAKVNSISSVTVTAGTKSLFRALGIPVAESATVANSPF